MHFRVSHPVTFTPTQEKDVHLTRASHERSRAARAAARVLRPVQERQLQWPEERCLQLDEMLKTLAELGAMASSVPGRVTVTGALTGSTDLQSVDDEGLGRRGAGLRRFDRTDLWEC